MTCPDFVTSRQRALLAMLADIPLPSNPENTPADAMTRMQARGSSAPWKPRRQTLCAHPWRRAIFRHTASLLAGKDAGEAVGWFLNPDTYVVGEWEALILLRVYHALKHHPAFLDSGAEVRVRHFLVSELLPRVRNEGAGLGRFSTGADAWCGSENHTIIGFSIRLLLEEMAGGDMDGERWHYAADQMRKWCREKATRGYTEYFSTHYSERTLIPLLNLFDYSIDGNLRQIAQMAIDQLIAEYTLVQINGFRGGAMRRCYQVWSDEIQQPEMTDSRYDSFCTMGQVFFGDAVTDAPYLYHFGEQTIGYLFYATTAYRPSPVHVKMADARVRGYLEVRSARKWDHERSEPTAPDTFIYAYATPHYVLGSIRAPAGILWGAGNLGVNCGVAFRLSFRKPRAMIGAARSSENAWLSDPPDAVALFQHRNVVFYFGEVDTYRAVAPEISDEEGVAHAESEGAFRFFREEGAGGEEVYVGVREENGVGVMEARLASQHASWDAFKAALKGNAARLAGRAEIVYTSCDGTAVEMKDGRAWVNGEAYPLEGWPLYDSRLMGGDWLNQSERAGVITIGDGATGWLVLDFRDLSRPVREVVGAGVSESPMCSRDR